jgi:hypothetical protein
MQAAPAPGTYQELSTEAQRDIHTWLAAMEAQKAAGDRQDRKVGLWVRGERRSGTSHVGATAMKQAVRTAELRETYGTDNWEYIACGDLTDLIRESWDEVPTKDEAAWIDALAVERMLDRLWSCDLLFLDDVHLGLISMALLVRAVLPKLEYRVKCCKPTLVTTSLTDENLGSLAPVFNGLFVVHDAVR